MRDTCFGNQSHTRMIWAAHMAVVRNCAGYLRGAFRSRLHQLRCLLRTQLPAISCACLRARAQAEHVSEG